MRRPDRRLAEDTGTAVVEVVPVAFAILLFLVLILVAGRVTTANLAVQDAARDAARQASIARTPQAAAAGADAGAATTLRADHLGCLSMVTADTAGFSVPVGQQAKVSVTVSCTVSLTGIPGAPGAQTVTSTFASPLDTFRER